MTKRSKNYIKRSTHFLNKYSKFLVPLLLLIALVAVTSILVTRDVRGKLSISGINIRRDTNKLTEISGVIKNNDYLKRDAEIKTYFYGPDGAILSVQEHTIKDVPANSHKNFSVYITHDISGFVRYEAKVVSAN